MSTSDLWMVTEPDMVGEILGTGYRRFWCEDQHVGGLCKIDGGRIDILAIVTDPQGAGYCRKFIQEAKSRFFQIYVWHVENPVLAKALQRWGFEHVEEIQTETGETAIGFKWIVTSDSSPAPTAATTAPTVPVNPPLPSSKTGSNMSNQSPTNSENTQHDEALKALKLAACHYGGITGLAQASQAVRNNPRLPAVTARTEADLHAAALAYFKAVVGDGPIRS